MTEKARFEIENSGHFEVQYNPEKFQVDRSANWSEASEQGQKSGLEYQKTKKHYMFQILTQIIQ
mgnify:CR=1 FL=1